MLLHWTIALALVAATVGYYWVAITYEPERPPSQGWDAPDASHRKVTP